MGKEKTPESKRGMKSSSSSPSVLNNISHGRGVVDLAQGLKKDRANSVRCNSGSGDDDDEDEREDEPSIFCSPPAATTTTRLSSRKRIRLLGKVTEGCKPVDPAAVPRRLRSAMNKRSHRLPSPSLPDSKKKRQLGPNGTLLPLVNGTGRFKQSMLPETITKDEEEVAETLSALTSLIPLRKPLEEERKLSEVVSKKKAKTISLSEASKERGAKILLPCLGTEIMNSSCVEESPKEKVMAEPSVREHHITVPGSQKFELKSNATVQPYFHPTPTSKKEHAERTYPRNYTKSSNSFGHSPLHIGNRVLPPSQLDTLPVHKPDIRLWPLGCNSGGIEPQPVKQISDYNPHNICREEITEDVRNCLPSICYGRLEMSSNKAAVLPDVTGVDRPNSTGNCVPTEKLHKRPSWKRCTTHVSISQLIKNHQESKRKGIPCQSNQLKDKESSSGAHTSNEMVELKNVPCSMISAGVHEPAMDSNIHEARRKIILDGRQAPQASMLLGTYAQQKQVCDFLSSSGTGETSSTGSAVKSSGQPNIPYLHSQFAQPLSTLPLPFPHAPYTSPYPDQLATATSLQLPHYVGNPLYSEHMVHAGGTTKQQQIWQTVFPQYKPPLGNIGTQSLPIGRQHEASSSTQLPPIFPPSLQNQLQSIPSPSSRSTRAQHHEASIFCSAGSPQLQLLCNNQK